MNLTFSMKGPQSLWLRLIFPRLFSGLSWWLSGKESSCQCRRCGFDPSVEKNPWSRKWQPIPVFLSGKFHGQRSLEGYCPWHCKSWTQLGNQTTAITVDCPGQRLLPLDSGWVGDALRPSLRISQCEAAGLKRVDVLGFC